MRYTLLIIALLLAVPATAAARPLPGGHVYRFAQRHSSLHRVNTTIDGHRVRIVSWRPRDPKLRVQVGWDRGRLAPYRWMRRDRRSLAVLNGDTWRWTTVQPSGTVVSQGRVIRIVHNGRPVVGFSHTGRVRWGRDAQRHRLPNMLSGLAYVVRHGRVIRRRQAVFMTDAQYACASTCWRSNFFQLRSGRVGFAEIAWAGPQEAGYILRRIGARVAMTMDAGGSSALDTRFDRGGCPSLGIGHCFGIATTGRHLGWERPVPSVFKLRWMG
jgi:hypothetical protein